MDPRLQTAPCGFLSVDDDGRILESNTTLAEMLSVKPGQLDNRHVDSIFAAPSRIFYQTHVFPTLKLQGRVMEVYVTLRDADGDDVPVMFNAVRKPRDERFVSDWMLMPMRQRDQYENLILEARRTAEATMQARTEALNAVAIWVKVLQHGSKDPAEVEQALKAIDKAVAEQSKLIDEIADFTRYFREKNPGA
ncbi:MAG TPA: PAS domain-containing protein [Usitatibacter sp.]|nr:PAS domain-containing protein [Usitatibacter sp.]